MEGEIVPIIRRGRQVGERRRYDNRLLMTALRQWRPVDPTDSARALTDFLHPPDAAEAKG